MSDSPSPDNAATEATASSSNPAAAPATLAALGTTTDTRQGTTPDAQGQPPAAKKPRNKRRSKEEFKAHYTSIHGKALSQFDAKKGVVDDVYKPNCLSILWVSFGEYHKWSTTPDDAKKALKEAILGEPGWRQRAGHAAPPPPTGPAAPQQQTGPAAPPPPTRPAGQPPTGPPAPPPSTGPAGSPALQATRPAAPPLPMPMGPAAPPPPTGPATPLHTAGGNCKNLNKEGEN